MRGAEGIGWQPNLTNETENKQAKVMVQEEIIVMMIVAVNGNDFAYDIEAYWRGFLAIGRAQ